MNNLVSLWLEQLDSFEILGIILECFGLKPFRILSAALYLSSWNPLESFALFRVSLQFLEYLGHLRSRQYLEPCLKSFFFDNWLWKLVSLSNNTEEELKIYSFIANYPIIETDILFDIFATDTNPKYHFYARYKAESKT